MYKLKSLYCCRSYYGLIHSFQSDRHQRVILNGQCSNWSHIKAGSSQGTILGPLLVSVYVNDLPEGLTTSAKLFADDTSFFSVVHDSAASSASLTHDLLKISRLAYQWQMIFNTIASKQAHFFSKASATNHGTVYFSNLPVIRKIFKSIKRGQCCKKNELAPATFFSADNI